MSELTKDELQQFWENCGWKIDVQCPECVAPHPIRLNPEGVEDILPDSSDLNAVFEALEWFCEKTDWGIVKLQLHKDMARPFKEHFQWQVELFKPSSEKKYYGPTINIAIIRAVNAAAESEAR